MDQDAGLRLLKAKLSATRRRLAFLAIGRAFRFAFLFLALFVCVALVGGFERLDGSVSVLLRLLLLSAGGWMIWTGVRRFRLPSREEAAALLDRQSLSRPVSFLNDRSTDPSQTAAALWRAERARCAGQVSTLRVPVLSDEWKSLDPFRLRYLLPVLVLVLAVAAGPRFAERSLSAFLPDIAVLAGADRIIVEAWVTPPEYTGQPPVLLKPGMTGLRVPQGSQVTLRTQASSAPSLVLRTDRSLRSRFRPTPDGSWESIARIQEDTYLSVRWWGERAGWDFSVIADLPPEIRFTEVPSAEGADKTKFGWRASDDYGIISVAASIRLQVPHAADPDARDRVEIVIPGVEGSREAEAVSQLDLTMHRWAGLPVYLQLIATDAAGQEGYGEPVAFTLPERLFLDPLASAAQEVRVTLLREPRAYRSIPANPSAVTQGAINADATGRLDYAPEGVLKAALMLEALTYRGELFLDNLGAFMGLRMALGVIQSASGKREADAAGELLWSVALKLEYGSVADARARLEMARAALERALRDGASEDEIRRLMEIFREAANEYLAARMAEAFANGSDAPRDQEDAGIGEAGRSLAGQDFEDMLNALQDLTETGASDQARQLLADISRLLENLEFERGQGQDGQRLPGQAGEAGEPDLPQEEQALTDAMRRLNEILREQRQLNDDTLASQRGEFSPQDEGGGENGVPGQAGEGEDGSLAGRQERLGRMVEEMARMPGVSGEEGAASSLDADSLAAIAGAQRRAGQALRGSQEGRALLDQEQATRSLSELSRGLAGELDRMRAERTGDTGQSSTDPFGRPMSGAGNDGQGVEIPAESERRRARDILDELRRRYGEAENEEERDYLGRLLDRF